MLKWLIAAVVLYGGFLALLYVAQRSLQYFPERRRTAPGTIGLQEAEEAVLDTADGERVIVWHVPPREGRPVFLYFHGNGGSLRWRDKRFRALIADGSGLVALSYRGYGGSSGRPTEAGLIEDAAAAYAFALARYPAERIVLWGKSLGSALAITVAAEEPVGCLVLEAPFTAQHACESTPATHGASSLVSSPSIARGAASNAPRVPSSGNPQRISFVPVICTYYLGNNNIWGVKSQANPQPRWPARPQPPSGGMGAAGAGVRCPGRRSGWKASP